MNETTATRYQRGRRRTDALVFASSAVALVAIGVSPAAAWLAGAADAFGRGLPPSLQRSLALVLLVAAVVVVCETAALAVRVARRQVDVLAAPAPGPEELLAAQAQAALLILPPALFAAAVVHLAALTLGPLWWAGAAVVLAAAMVTAVYGGPALVARLSRTAPLTRPALADRLAALARRAGVPVAGIDEIRSADAGTITAMVSGLGRSRRVFVSADVARDWSDEEIAVVVAHEIAHHANHDLARTLALDALIVAIALGTADLVLRVAAPQLVIAGAADLAALPLIAAVGGAVWSAATPLRHAESRRQERLADARALVMTGQPDAFGSALRRLGERRLAEERPTLLTQWLYHRHPTAIERLAMAETYRQSSPRA